MENIFGEQASFLRVSTTGSSCFSDKTVQTILQDSCELIFLNIPVFPAPSTYSIRKKVSGTQRNIIIGIICTIIAGLAILGVVVCVIHTRRRSKHIHIREASFERYQTKMLEVPDVSSSNPQPSANCWKQISYTPQTHSSRGKQILKISFQLRARTANR